MTIVLYYVLLLCTCMRVHGYNYNCSVYASESMTVLGK